MDNDDNKNNNNKTSSKRSLDFNNLKRLKPTTKSSTRSTRSTRSSTSINTEINEQNNLKDTKANHQTISDASQIETPKKTKIARLDLFRDRDIDEIIISTNKTTKGSSQAINESSTISSYIPLVVISPPSFSPSSSIKTTISDKAASGNKAASGKISSYIPSVVISPPFSIKTTISDKEASNKVASDKASDKAASGKTASGKAAFGKITSGKASGKAASSSSKSSSSSVKAVISKELPLDNNVTTSLFKVTDQAVSSGEFAKLIQINQKTASKLNTIINNQKRFKAMLNEQKDQISNIMSVLDSHRNVETEVEVKKKGKTKKKDKNSDEFYHLLAANCVKKDYYIRKLKESLWSTFDTDVDSEECEYESSPKTPITPIDDDDEIIEVDHRVDDVYDKHMTDDNQAADLEIADLEGEQ
ncbi:uncharacterized protein OCT59_018722 [Rhizophagus irregularis]|uniref:uncharacterized protein n=1 Tax=Rhizophagus irregularis TaxID=588596 RepID=UPI003316E59A|nr:hypothetical protein OCT59_018722 [Rhizophagus irregularis]